MALELTSGLYLRSDSTPLHSTLAPSAILCDGILGNQNLEDGSLGTWTVGLSIGADLGSPQRITDVILHNYSGYADQVMVGWSRYRGVFTIGVYTSNDNDSWVHQGNFTEPEIIFKSIFRFSFRVGLPENTVTRYVKILFVSGTTRAIQFTNGYWDGHCTEIEVSGIEGNADSELFLFESGEAFIPASGSCDLHLLSCWENTTAGACDLYLFTSYGQELIQASGSCEIELLESYGYEGAKAISDLFLLESAGNLLTVNTAAGVSSIFLLESEGETGEINSSLYLLQTSGTAEVLPQWVSEIYLLKTLGQLSVVNMSSGIGFLYQYMSEARSMEIYGEGESEVYLLRSRSENYVSPGYDDDFSGELLPVQREVVLEYYNAY